MFNFMEFGTVHNMSIYFEGFHHKLLVYSDNFELVFLICLLQQIEEIEMWITFGGKSD